MAGRKEDSIWQFYIKTTSSNKSGCRATCKQCKKEIQGIVQRLKAHHDVCKRQQNKQGTTTNANIDLPPNFFETGSASSSFTFSSTGSNSPSECLLCYTQTTTESASKRKKRESQSSMSNFVRRTSAGKKLIDKQIAKAIFATNSRFLETLKPLINLL